MKAFLKKYWEYIAALLIPLFVILLHCATRGVWLFGDKSLLRGDANIQYFYLFEELWNKVHSGDFSFFSWNALGGFDYYLNALYYTISPATIIVLLLPKTCMHDALQLFMVLKWMLMSFTAVYFFMHTRFNRLKEYRRWVSLVLGLCYIMGNYFLGILSFFNWLDTLILFPILLLLVERMVEQQSWKLYYIVLTISMLCNFYIAFPVCVFLFLWFLLQIQMSPKNSIRKVGVFIGSSVLSALSTMGVIIPCVMNVNERYLEGQNNEVSTYIRSIRLSLSEWIQSFFLLDITDVGDMHDTPFYFSLGLILLSMLFIFIKLNKREKWSKVCIILFVVISFFVGALNYIWHGLSVPHGIDQRYAFVFYMMMCVMALDVLCCLEQIRIRHALVVALVSILAFVHGFFGVRVFDEFYVYLSTILVLAFSFILIVLYCRRSIKKESFIIVFLSVCLVEVCANAYVQLQWFEVTEPLHMECIEDSDKLVERMELNSGDKIIMADTGYNLGLEYDIPNMSGFVSYSYGNMSDLAMYLGMHVVEDAGTHYIGASPVVNYIYNIRYGVGSWKAEFSDAELVDTNGKLSLFEMQQKSSLGYMVKETSREWELDGASVWNTQNQYLKSMLDEDIEAFRMFLPEGIECQPMIGIADVVSKDEKNGSIAYGYVAGYESDGNILRFTADRDMDLYVNLRGTHSIKAYASVEQEEIFFDTQTRGQTTIHIGEVKKGEEVSVICVIEGAVGERVEVMASFAEFDQEVYDEAYKKLSKNLYEVIEMEGDTVKGTIKADEAGIMMTSIPAMNGFTVYVDGTETAYETIGGALIGVPLEAGEHQVEFHYETRYAKLAWLLSLAGVAIFGVICGVDYYRKKKAVQE